MSKEQLANVICLSNRIWSHQDQRALEQDRKQQQRLDEAQQAYEKQQALIEQDGQRYREEVQSCRSNRLTEQYLSCVGRLKPPQFPTLVEPVIAEPPEIGSNDLFQQVTDVSNELLLIDGSEAKWVGGMGVLAGDALALARYVSDLFSAGRP